MTRRGLTRVRLPRALVEGVAVILAFAVGTFLFFWPVFENPATSVVKKPAIVTADIYLTMWILAWDWHALTSMPWNLFHANVFYPAPYALAASEHMLGHLVIFGPVFGVTGNPVLAYQVNLFLSLVLSGVGAHALFRHWGMGIPAALFGAFVYAFFPGRAGTIGHAHLVAGQYLPLALLFLERALLEGRRRYAAGFGLFLLLQMLCSYYLAYASVFLTAAYGAVLLGGARRVGLRGLRTTAAAAGVVFAVFLLLTAPYLLRGLEGVIPNYSNSAWLRATSASLWENYLYPPKALSDWGWRLPKGGSLYLGVVPLFFAVSGLLFARDRQGPARLYVVGSLAVFLVGYVLALGPEVSIRGCSVATPYRLLVEVVPGLGAVRAPWRYGLLFVLGFAGLAALGFARLLDRRTWLAGGALLPALALTAWEYGLLEADHEVQRVPTGPPPIYRALVRRASGPLLEIPAGVGDGDVLGALRESRYSYFSIYHWRPLLNGYSAYKAPSYWLLMKLARALPNPKALNLLQRTTGLKYVIVHNSDLRPAERRLWERPEGLQLLDRRGSDLLFTTTHARAVDLKGELLRSTGRDRTLLGVPLAPLPADRQRAEFRARTTPGAVAFRGLPYFLDLTVENAGSDAWPVLTPTGEHVVQVGFEWRNPDGSIVHSGTLSRSGLPYDVFPGEAAPASLWIPTPKASGSYRLYVGLVQDGNWFPGRFGPLSVDVRVFVPARPREFVFPGPLRKGLSRHSYQRHPEWGS